ncbi:MAG: hypothetical protein WBP59_02435 [Ilumatobacteraceae bacterium]
MRTTPVRFTRLCLGVVVTLGLVACGGGSDDDSSSDGESDDAATGATTAVSGTIELLVGDGSTEYTISLPDGFAEVEPASPVSPRFEHPDEEFGERSTRVELQYLPGATDAAALVSEWMSVNSTITVIDQADEGDLSWFTFTTPSTSDANKIAFGTAGTSLTLEDGSALKCRALTQNGIDEEWSEADAASIAAANLEICRTLTAG